MLGRTRSVSKLEAIALTFGAMILVFGIYLIFRPSPEGDEFRPYKYYDWLGTQASIQPHSVVSHSFEAREGELMEVNARLWGVDGDDIIERFEHYLSVSLKDPAGSVLMEDGATQEAYAMVSIKQTGKYEIEVVNPSDYVYHISVGVNIAEKTPPLWANMGPMFIFMSLPAFVLAAWLFLVNRP